MTASIAAQPSPQLSDRGDGSIQDSRSNLTWLKCPVGQRYAGHLCSGHAQLLGWRRAQQRCALRHDLGFHDWRLPSRDDLLSLLDMGLSAPYYPAEYFGAMNPPVLWNAAAITDERGVHGEAINFLTGARFAMQGPRAFALCVRGGGAAP
ncbi:MAG: DUF1566 domain-containing protein [Leptospirales bacterium]|nr:DUF1566 domain-containing protein [Leptospirales bacterium]